jgi:hypothetical protein
MMMRMMTGEVKVKKDEAREILRERGMDPEEIEKFIGDGELATIGVQVPPDKALGMMQDIVKFGLLAGPIRFFVLLPAENRERLREIVAREGQEPLIIENFASQEGDYYDTLEEGFKGDSLLGDDEGKIKH